MHAQEFKATKKQVVRLQLNEKKSKESQMRLMSWYWKRKLTWRKDLITYNVHPWIMFSFNWLVIIWRRRRGGSSLEIGRPRSRVSNNFWHRWTRGWGVLKIRQFSWTSNMYHPLLYYPNLTFVMMIINNSLGMSTKLFHFSLKNCKNRP